MDLHSVQRPEFHGPRVHHFCPAPGHLRHLLRGDERYAPGFGDYARVGRVDAVHVRVDLTPLRPERRRERDGGRVRAAAPERHNVAHGVHALKPGDDDDVFFIEETADAFGSYLRDHTGAVSARDPKPRLRTCKRDRCQPPVVERHRQESHRLLLAGG